MPGQALTEHDMMSNGFTNQMTPSQRSRRLSRGSGSYHGTQSRQPPSRVEKPRSIHNSPSVAERRRTIAFATKRYSTLEDHYNNMFGWDDSNAMDATPELKPATRPVSWHPGSYRAHEHSNSPVDALASNGYGSVQYGSMDVDAASQTTGYHYYHPAMAHHQQSLHSGYASSVMTPAVESYNTSPMWEAASTGREDSKNNMSSHSQLNMQPATWSVPDWVQMTQSKTDTSNQRESDFLPIQRPQQEAEADVASPTATEETGEVLVGMGLYDDPPEGYDSWFASESRLGGGKGLKLEETWEPPEPKEDDDEEEEEEDEEEPEDDAEEDEDTDNVDRSDDIPDDTSSAKSVEEPPAPTPLDVPEPHQWSVHEQQAFPANMSGQSFFFEEDETYTNEWWFHQLKQPMAQVQDAGLGYGWLQST